MKKVMLLAAMLAMVLAAAAPAFGQAVAIDEGDDVEYNAVCQNIIGGFGDITQAQYGDADAVAVDDSAAAAEVAQSQGVTIEQVNECLNNFATASATATATATATVSGSSGSSSGSSGSSSGGSSSGGGTTTVLPATGGASLLVLGAGALLVAGGLVARRIVR
jgi:hypothetical protein